MPWVIAGGAVLGGALGAFGSNKAANQQKKAAKQSAGVQQYMFDQSQAAQAPWQQTGASALAQLAGLYGLNPINYIGQQAGQAVPPYQMHGSSVSEIPGAANYMGLTPNDPTGQAVSGGQYAGGVPVDPVTGTPLTPPPFGSNVPTREAAMANFQTSPGYQFRMDEAMKAIGGMASAQGLRGAGATTEDIMRYSQGLASSEFGDYTNRLAALAGIGQTSAGQMGNQALVTGRGIGDAYSQAGNARASGILGVTNSLGNAANNAAWMWGMYGGKPGGGTPPPASGGGGGTGWW